jgi:transcriptional regulator with XRE-family HTH domain
MAIPRRKDRQNATVFGALIRRLRGARGLAVRDVARATGIAHATWSRGERGLLDLRRWDYVIPLANALGLPLKEMAKAAGVEAEFRDRFDAIEIEGVHRKPRKSGPGVVAKWEGCFSAQAGIAEVGVTVRATQSLLEDLGADVGEFQKALSAVLRESHRRGDPALLREVSAYAKGLLARSSSGGRKRRKPAPL